MKKNIPEAEGLLAENMIKHELWAQLNIGDYMNSFSVVVWDKKPVLDEHLCVNRLKPQDAVPLFYVDPFFFNLIFGFWIKDGQMFHFVPGEAWSDVTDVEALRELT